MVTGYRAQKAVTSINFEVLFPRIPAVTGTSNIEFLAPIEDDFRYLNISV